MKDILFILSLITITSVFSQAETSQVSHEDEGYPFSELTGTFGKIDPQESLEIFELFQSTPGGINVLDWEWKELGPLGTPSEGKESKALPSYSLGCGDGTGRINNLFVNSSNENQIFACFPAGGLFFSIDRGDNWSSGGIDKLPISGVSSITVNPLNQNNWIISIGNGDDNFSFSNGVYRTLNSGNTWEQTNGRSNYELPFDENGFFLKVYLELELVVLRLIM